VISKEENDDGRERVTEEEEQVTIKGDKISDSQVEQE